MNFGFTGTKLGMTEPQRLAVGAILIKNFIAGAEFHHGDCVGADVQAAALADPLGYIVVCHPPVNPKRRGWFSFNKRTNPPYDYVIRDHHIVDDTQILIAAPHTPYEVIRSGTWTTVRYARELNRPIWIVHPNGTLKCESYS